MADEHTQPENREAERNQLAEQSRRQHERDANADAQREAPRDDRAAAGTPAENAPEKKSRVDTYHEQFAEKMIKALQDNRAPWQQPWKPGEQISPKNVSSDRNYRGGNAIYLAVVAVEKGYADPRWAGYRQIAEAGGHVRKGEKGTPILYVEYTSREVEKDARGNPVVVDGHKQYTETQRDRPMVKIHTVFNVEQTEGLKLPPVGNREAPAWEANKRVEDLVRHGEVRVDHVQGDQAYYNKAQDRVVLPDPSQFPTSTGYVHTALHELGHATGHESRLNRPTMMKHEGFGSQSYAREELRAEMAAMMAGEQLGVGHEPRHGQAYVASWIKALENDPKEIRFAAVDAQKAADWMVERARTIEKQPPREVDREPVRVLDGRGPDVPPPPPPLRAPEPAPTTREAVRDVGPSR